MSSPARRLLSALKVVLRPRAAYTGTALLQMDGSKNTVCSQCAGRKSSTCKMAMLFFRGEEDADTSQYSAARSAGRTTDPLLEHPLGQELNLPHGLFALRNRGTGRVLDVRGGSIDPGAQICLYTAKPVVTDQPGGLYSEKNNQVFYLDSDGHLVSAAAGLHVAIADGEPYLATLQPILPFWHTQASRGFPPRFRLDPSTSTLHTLPCYSARTSASDGDAILEAVPLRKQKSGKSWSAVTGLFGGGNADAVQKAKQAAREAQTDSEDEHEDDDPGGLRMLRVVTLLPAWRDKVPNDVLNPTRSNTNDAEHRRWRRRQWDVIPVATPSNDDPTLRQRDETEADAVAV